MFLLGMVLFVVASVVPASPSAAGILIAARLVQGIGAAMILPGHAVDPQRHLHRP